MYLQMDNCLNQSAHSKYLKANWPKPCDGVCERLESGEGEVNHAARAVVAEMHRSDLGMAQYCL